MEQLKALEGKGGEGRKAAAYAHPEQKQQLRVEASAAGRPKGDKAYQESAGNVDAERFYRERAALLDRDKPYEISAYRAYEAACSNDDTIEHGRDPQ